MFNTINKAIRKVGEFLGIIDKLKTVQDLKEIAVSNEFYQEIIKWRELHRGYHGPIHDVECKTVSGTHTRRLATLNMPKVITQELATTIFNERCTISIGDEDYNDFINGVFKDNAFNSKFQQYLEFMFAQGGMVVKPYANNGQIKLSYVTADSFIPTSWDQSGDVSEGVFVSEIQKFGKYYTHLEWHYFEGGLYIIKNELYESDNNATLGYKVGINKLYPNLEERVELSGIERKLFAYFKPNTANNIDPTIPLGISLYANSIDTLKSLDIAFDSWQREFRLGRKRIIVPTSALRVVTDPTTGRQTRYFDTNDEAYEGFDVGMDSNTIQEISSTLRVQEHIDSINALLNVLSVQIGLSPGAISFDAATGIKTATEVVSENSKTFRTKQSHENVIEQGIADLIEAIGIVAELYDLYTPPADYDVTVTFDDSVIQDRNAEINEEILLISSGLQTKVRAIMRIHGLAEEEAIKFLDDIKAESLDSEPSFTEIQDRVNIGGVVE